MGYTAIQMKLMPTSPEVNLQEIEKKAEELINSMHKTKVGIEEQPIAFGLKAIILSFAWNDEIEIEHLETKMQALENVSSAEITDIRKAFG